LTVLGVGVGFRSDNFYPFLAGGYGGGDCELTGIFAVVVGDESDAVGITFGGFACAYEEVSEVSPAAV